MIILLLAVHILIAIALVGVVLLQKSEGGALGSIGGGAGMAGFMTGRSTANLLTRATAILFALFVVTSGRPRPRFSAISRRACRSCRPRRAGPNRPACRSRISFRHPGGRTAGDAVDWDSMTRFIFITGGVVSSLGKGLAAAALGALLQARGFRVRLRKFDPYLNVDPGTMSPYQHGEVFVTDDGAETDLDLGHYERYVGIAARKSDSVTTGRIYSTVISRERKGEYLGATVQVIPHVTDAIKEFIQADLGDEDFVLCEVGGTVGDIESLPFLEAIRQMGNELGRERVMYVHLTLVPWIPSAGELKTKPTQHSVKELLGLGIQPDILLCRCDRPIPEGARKKIALFCNLRESRVIPALDVDTIYDVPNAYHAEGFDDGVCDLFGLPQREPGLARWGEIVNRIRRPEGEVNIAVVGKYTHLLDSYKSLAEALAHGGIANHVKVKLDWLDSEIFEQEGAVQRLSSVHGILVPGGFGERGA